MKNSSSSGATIFIKQIISLLRTMAKAKSMAIKSKTEAIRARFLVFSLLRNKKLSLVSLSHKIHSLLPGGGRNIKTGGQHDHHDMQQQLAANRLQHESQCSTSADLGAHGHELQLQVPEDLDSHDPYPDDSADDDELDRLLLQNGNPNASVVDLLRTSREEGGENFSLEAEIDHVADLFIMKFHKRMRMQKLESFKRYQQMLERSA